MPEKISKFGLIDFVRSCSSVENNVSAYKYTQITDADLKNRRCSACKVFMVDSNSTEL
ncbi:MAG: hypothetical protein LBK94_10375 [Prevotellaceae bacterium]|jgi:hypothetical protein|nr:hypothetical protein [Prevotellaceae bacterium]